MKWFQNLILLMIIYPTSFASEGCHQSSVLCKLTTAPITTTAGDRTDACFARSAIVWSVPMIVRCWLVVPDSIHAAGVEGSAPLSISTCVIAGKHQAGFKK